MRGFRVVDGKEAEARVLREGFVRLLRDDGGG